MALLDKHSNPSVYVSFFRNPLCSEYETILDHYRLPLENLSLKEQQAQSDNWVEQIFTRIDEDRFLDDKFWKSVEAMAKLRHFNWDKHVDVLMLTQCFLPPIHNMVDCKRESFSLLMLMMELRSECQKYPEKRDYIQEIARKCTKMFVYQLDERKKSDYYVKTAAHGIGGITLVMMGSWLFSVSPLTMCIMIWLGTKIWK